MVQNNKLPFHCLHSPWEILNSKILVRNALENAKEETNNIVIDIRKKISYQISNTTAPNNTKCRVVFN